MNAVVYGLISATTWGAGDFFGGMAVKRSNPYGVVILAHFLSLLLVSGLALILGETIPPAADWFWGGLAGICGGVGLAFLYRSLATGRMSVAAPVSAIVAAALPVIVGSVIDGLVDWPTWVGFGLALMAVWLISGGLAIHNALDNFRLPILAGLCFGGFFILLHMASSVSILWPMVAIRMISISSLLAYSLISRQAWLPSRESWLAIVLSAILDSAGNAFYALSSQAGRMDIAAVLGSLYPASTVLLAWVFLRERISRLQGMGILAALAAIVMITV